MTNWTEIEKAFDLAYPPIVGNRVVEGRDTLKSFLKTHLEAAYQEGRREVLQEAIKIVQQKFEKHEDTGDERYGYVKHYNTLLQRLEDDLLIDLTALSSPESKEQRLVDSEKK
jgi:hypothetical protein